MRKIMISPVIAAISLLFAYSVAKAGDKYEETMKKNIVAVYAAKTIEEIQSLVNTFERVGEAEKNKWEPFYYAGYGYVMMTMRESEGVKKDGYLDLALKAIEKAKSLKQNESEVIALEGFVHMIRVTVDPATRGQQYSGLAFQSFNKAVSMNPNNPRALYLLAQMQFGMAQFFGSPTTEACGTLNKALERFENYQTESPLAPQWGKQMAEKLKNQCQ